MSPITCRGLAIVLSALLLAQPAPAAPPTAPAAPPPTATPTTPPPVAISRDEEAVIPELDLKDGTLEDLIAILQKADPSFKAVVFREKGVGPDVPRIRLQVKGASRQQILDLLSVRHNNVESRKLAGGPEAIHTFRVSRPANGNTVEAPPYVRVYPLAAAIQRLIETRPEGDAKNAKPLSQKEALNRVLSLVQAVSSTQESPDGTPSLQVHEDTQTLIVRATTPEHRVLEETLAALTKRSASDRELEVAKENMLRNLDRGKQREAELEVALDRLQKREETHVQEILEKAQQIERLKVRVEELERRAGSVKP
jgi:hypothetical protein